MLDMFGNNTAGDVQSTSSKHFERAVTKHVRKTCTSTIYKQLTRKIEDKSKRRMKDDEMDLKAWNREVRN
jgi:hypothetical protein